MKCMYCQAEMKKGVAPFNVERKGIHLRIDEVPAWICPQCGETYFEEDEVQCIQDMIKTIEAQTEQLSEKAGVA